MPIQPIDLQVLFAHLNQVGKEQAVQKNAAVIQQAAQANEMIEKSDQQDHSINETKELEDGPEKVDDKKDHKKQHHEAGKKRDEPGQEDSEEELDDILRDPDLGHHIDITG